jgi:Ser/Thr protein kinase RdoA (MazF antagonist)
MTSAPNPTALSPLAAFDALERGEAAPDWILHGIRSSWTLAEPVAARLIAVSENATFLVSADGAPTMVVRLHRPGYVGDIRNVRSELTWIEAVSRDTGVVTPAPVRGSDGGLVQSFAGAGGVRWTAVAFGYVDGSILEEHQDLAPHFTEIGRTTAVLHEHSRAWLPPADFTRFSWDYSDMVGPRARWGNWEDARLSPAEHHVAKKAEGRALDVLGDMAKSKQNWGLIHSDLRPSNIMIRGDVLTVIDFDDSGFSWYLYDFASALTFYEHRSEAPEMAANWLAGYAEIYRLGQRDLQRAAALSVIRRLTMLGWATTHRADALPRDLWEENAPGTVEICARYLKRPTWLVDPA